jgi:hypothetical protein
MLERFAALRSQIVQHLAPLWARACEAMRPQLRQLKADAKRGLADALSPFEAVLLSGPARERMHASAVFALIFAFGFTSVDFLLSGGFDLNSRPAARQIAYQSLISDRVELAALPAEDVIAPETIRRRAPRATVTQTAYEPETVEPVIAEPPKSPEPELPEEGTKSEA